MRTGGFRAALLSGGAQLASSLNLNFINGHPIDPRINFSRASGGTYYDATGTMQTAANNVPRLDYGPTVAPVTNFIANSTMVGAAAGTPGTPPTNWSVSSGNTSLTSSIVGAGIDGGMPYLDVTFAGTISSGNYVQVNFSSVIGQLLAQGNQTWTLSLYVKLQGGTWPTGAVINAGLIQYNSSNVYINQPSGGSIAPTSASLATQRLVYSEAALSNVASIIPGIFINSIPTGVINFTLRIGAPQLELASTAGVFVPTAGQYASVTNAGAFNTIRNSTMQGASAGTPGVLPTHWNLANPQVNITTQVVGSGIVNGMPYIDMRWYGTAASGGELVGWSTEASNIISAYTGQVWTYSSYLAMVSGSFSGVSGFRFNLTETNNTGGFVAQQDLNISVNSTLTRVSGTGTLFGGSNTAFVVPNFYFGFASLATVDFTMRIAAPQLELSSVANPFTPTFGAAAGMPQATSVTNWIPYSNMSNAVVGTPGTIPAFGFAPTVTGLTRSVVNTGVINGLPYIDLQVSGTPSAAGNINMYGASVIVSPGQAWTFSAYTALISGTTTGMSLSQNVLVSSETSGYIYGSFVGIPLTSILTRNTSTQTMGVSPIPVGAQTQFAIALTGVAVNFTIRIAGIQFEQGFCANNFVSAGAVATNQGNLPCGLLVEEARTNSIRNPRCEGAVAATTITPVTITSIVNSGTTATVNTATAHGLSINYPVIMVGQNVAANTGVFTVASVPTSTSFTYTMASTPGSSPTTVGSYTATTIGTIPTYQGYAINAGITVSIVGTSYESGCPYTDYRVAGTPTSTGNGVNVSFDASTAIPAAIGQTWAGSFYGRIVAGSAANVTLLASVTEISSTSGYLGDSHVVFTPTSAPLVTQRNPVTRTLFETGVSYISLGFFMNYTAGLSFDFTLRIGAPQLEQGATVTSLMLPAIGTPAASSRAQDFPLLPVGSWFNPNAGTLTVEAMIPTLNPTNTMRLASLDDGTVNNRQMLYVAGGATAVTAAVEHASASAAAPLSVSGAVVAGSVFKTALAQGNGSVMLATKGVLSVSGPTVSLTPLGVTGLSIGYARSIGYPINGYIRRIQYWPRAINNNELIKVTT